MEEQEPMNYEIKKLLDQIRRSTSVFAGRFEKNRSDEVQKMESNYSKMWVEANKKQLSELLLNEKKKRDVKYFNKLQEESINHGEEITALDSTNPQALTRQNCPPPGLRPIGRPNEVSSQDQNILQYNIKLKATLNKYGERSNHLFV